MSSAKYILDDYYIKPKDGWLSINDPEYYSAKNLKTILSY
jgi:hypothetical protein